MIISTPVGSTAVGVLSGVSSGAGAGVGTGMSVAAWGVLVGILAIALIAVIIATVVSRNKDNDRKIANRKKERDRDEPQRQRAKDIEEVTKDINKSHDDENEKGIGGKGSRDDGLDGFDEDELFSELEKKANGLRDDINDNIRNNTNDINHNNHNNHDIHNIYNNGDNIQVNYLREKDAPGAILPREGNRRRTGEER